MAELISLPTKTPISEEELKQYRISVQKAAGGSPQIDLHTAFETKQYVLGTPAADAPAIRQTIPSSTWTTVLLPVPQRDTTGRVLVSGDRMLQPETEYGEFYHTIYSVAWDYKATSGNPLTTHLRKVQEFVYIIDPPLPAPWCEYAKVYIAGADKGDVSFDALTPHQTYMQPGLPSLTPDNMWEAIRVWHNNGEPVDLVSIPNIAPGISGWRASTYYPHS